MGYVIHSTTKGSGLKMRRAEFEVAHRHADGVLRPVQLLGYVSPSGRFGAVRNASRRSMYAWTVYHLATGHVVPTYASNRDEAYAYIAGLEQTDTPALDAATLGTVPDHPNVKGEVQIMRDVVNATREAIAEMKWAVTA